MPPDYSFLVFIQPIRLDFGGSLVLFNLGVILEQLINILCVIIFVYDFFNFTDVFGFCLRLSTHQNFPVVKNQVFTMFAAGSKHVGDGLGD